jgi:segregation and condensation protein B
MTAHGRDDETSVATEEQQTLENNDIAEQAPVTENIMDGSDAVGKPVFPDVDAALDDQGLEAVEVEPHDESMAMISKDQVEDHADDVTSPVALDIHVVEVTDAVGMPVFPEGEDGSGAQSVELPGDGEMQLLTALERDDGDADDEFQDERTADDRPASEEALTEDEGGRHLLKEELTLAGKIESIVFASPKPMRAVEIHELLIDQGYTLKEVQDTCDELVEYYRDRAGGFHLKYIKRMGYQFQTTPAAKPLMEKQFSSRPRPLSRASLETLAVVAYRQKQSKGVTRAEVEFIRGVDAGSIFKTLVERNLLTCTGRKEIPGRPMMFGVTDEFLKIFQLGSINDLPPLESFQTPQDILQAANGKIAAFEAEQEGVDPEGFIGDEEYTSEVMGPEEFNPLAAEAPAYAPTLERVDEVRVDEDARLAETNDLAGDLPKTVMANDAPESSDPDLIDVLQEGQVAWVAPDGHTEERLLQGASVGDVETDLCVSNEGDWDNDVQVETTSTAAAEAVATPGSEAQLDERDETSKVAISIGDSQPPRGGEVDQ